MMHHLPKKRFGQHFLTDVSVIDALLSAIHPMPEEVLVEIGPGVGALTEPLLRYVASMHIIEIDRDLIAYWRRRHPDRLTVHAGDVLDFDYAMLPDRFRLIGNLPYNISTPILLNLRAAADRLQDAHVMLQKEVVDRLAASPGSKTYGRLSVMLQYDFDIEYLFDVPPEAFDPPPKVNSSVVRMTPKRTKSPCDPVLFSDVVRIAFGQRRKQLGNALKSQLSPSDFAALDIDPHARAEMLSVEDFVRIANWLEHKARTDGRLNDCSIGQSY